MSSVTANMNTDFDVAKLERFKVNHAFIGIAEPAFEEALEKAKTNSHWVKQNKENLKVWFTENNVPDKPIGWYQL